MEIPSEFKNTNPIDKWIKVAMLHEANQLAESKAITTDKQGIGLDLCYCPKCGRVFSMEILKGETYQQYYNALPKTQHITLCDPCFVEVCDEN
jgi:hypothetical protein